MWKLDPPGLLCTRVFQGRMYVNISWVLWHGDALPGISAAAFERHLFGQHVGLTISRPTVTWAEKTVARLMTWRLALNYTRAIAGRNRRLAQALKARSELDVRNVTNVQIAALIPSLRRAIEVGSDWNTRGTIFAMTAIGALSRAAGPQLAHLILPLLSDVGDVESAAPARRIRLLASQARRKYPDLGPRLSAASNRWQLLAEQAPELKAELDAVLVRYGYRSVAEFYLSSPSWSNDPTPVMDAFIGLLQAADNGEDEMRVGDERLAELLSQVGLPKRLLLTALSRAARAGAQTREVTKAALVIRVDIMRQLMREVARRMIAVGCLQQPADLYYLTLDEILGYLRGGSTERLDELIRIRRVQRAECEQGHEPPDLLFGREPLESAKVAGSGEVGSVMNGLGVSGGVVEGVARVVHGTDSLDRFEPDEILVAPFTDAGWTPYFTLASAVIVENGGILTHTSVVARELGLPAIVNVRNATTLIRTGDRLRLDADKGVVEIISRPLISSAA
jgi:pyruvate,water dikinase